MLPYKKDDIEKILQRSYYDRRTDYVWNYLIGDKQDLIKDPYPIPDIDSFLVTHEMMKMRKATIAEFLEQWDTTEHPGLTECTYNKKSGTLRVTARSFRFTYREKANEYHFMAYAEVAKAIRLENRELKKIYRKNGLFPIECLMELDEQMYSRYSEKKKLLKWRKSPQFELDRSYCEQMIPFIMKDAQIWQRDLRYGQRLNIILDGNDKVRISIVEAYSPEEMMSMPSYPRKDWQKGITATFDKMEKDYAENLERQAKEAREWSEELTRIVLGKTPYSIDRNCINRHFGSDDRKYITKLINAAVGIPVETNSTPRKLEFFFMTKDKYTSNDEEETENCTTKVYNAFSIEVNMQKRIATITLKEEIANALNYERVTEIKIPDQTEIDGNLLKMDDISLMDEYENYLTTQERLKSPLHQQLIEEVRYIIEQTAPLIAYTGTNEIIKCGYLLMMETEDNDKIRVKAHFSDWNEAETFSLDDYRSTFRVWWSKMLLRECKNAKEQALNPKINPLLDLPF